MSIIVLVNVILFLAALKDERLNRTFSGGNVKFLRPAENAEDWFNLFIIHQNR